MSNKTYNSYGEFLIDLIKETNKIISLVPKDNDVSQYHYDIVYNLHRLKKIYAELKSLEKNNEILRDENSKLQSRLKSCEENLKHWIEEHSKLSKKLKIKKGE